MDNRKKPGIIKRILALLGVFALLLLVILTLVFAVTGNPNFFGMLLITLMAPILLWVYAFIYKLVRGKSAEEMAEEEIERKKNAPDK
ncbi:MAG: hypothetical protein Q4B70_10045 [Lachnospiraceae bacterium]|nr:hypothetical protein [Lachnospiraceae bacterium]